MNIRLVFEVELFNEAAAVIKCNSKTIEKSILLHSLQTKNLKVTAADLLLQIQATVTLM